MALGNALDVLQAVRPHGFCLWVGAGVSYRLAAGTSKPAFWSRLVQDLETMVGLSTPPASASYPERLERCLRELGRYRFQIELRRRVLNPLCESIIETAKASPGTTPDAAKEVACLGRFANPIVNFNVEHLTSLMAALPAGPMALKSFAPSIKGQVNDPFEVRVEAVANDRRFRRNVYHPHGSLHSGGICVMTSTEYAALNGTLALELATHMAFGQHLLIVGMSLDDAYLRQQLERFRGHIRRIVWFSSNLPASLDLDTQRWAWANAVDVVPVAKDWSDFWAAAGARLDTGGRDELEVLVAWHNVVLESYSMLMNPKSNWIKLVRDHSVMTPQQAAEWSLAALNSGEILDDEVPPHLETELPTTLQPLRDRISSVASRSWEEMKTGAGYIVLQQ